MKRVIMMAGIVVVGNLTTDTAWASILVALILWFTIVGEPS